MEWMRRCWPRSPAATRLECSGWMFNRRHLKEIKTKKSPAAKGHRACISVIRSVVARRRSDEAIQISSLRFRLDGLLRLRSQ
jgi:hypothetical protein